MVCLREITVHDLFVLQWGACAKLPYTTAPPTGQLRKKSRSKFVFFAGTSVHMGVGMGGTSLSQLTDVPVEK
jgi:hypothetical protein